MNSISANLRIMIKAAEKASKILIRDFGEIEKLQVSIKGPADFVSSSDKKSEKTIIDIFLLRLNKKLQLKSFTEIQVKTFSNNSKNNDFKIKYNKEKYQYILSIKIGIYNINEMLDYIFNKNKNLNYVFI